ncbi:uncharacterized protein BDZ99DRAFT_227393 [Mytilinidion resinicola]|uniref:C2H2-type domain-containing protein n=1 Tax=Mytilinidion resinicola TaxID=574789 RepID=A0A6A6YY93_9PEZI|nr:uncharacterized protein BDZ99DRAFT_227393 [Mytilinidion resinicola]KAF2813916.1 hypothetical protein BDZ99DRAFT_227393 [Mytilinidion resinicola]
MGCYGDPIECSYYDEYSCNRCNREFRSENAARQHVQNSPRHHPCDVGSCNYDADGREDLLDHWRQEECRIVCEGCQKGIMPHYFDQHLADEYVCGTCDRHHNSYSNLEHHKLVHLPLTLECWGCERKFATIPAMMIHLESGSCTSGIDEIDLNQSAAMCFQWKHFVREDLRDDLLHRVDLDQEYQLSYPFECPGCHTGFRYISGLFMHVASPSCNETLDDFAMAKLIRWLKNRHA